LTHPRRGRNGRLGITARGVRTPTRAGGGDSPARSTEDGALRKRLSELLRAFYARGWVSGTGGGICARFSARGLLLAPSAVPKERVRPRDFFVVDPDDGRILHRPSNPTLRPSECNAVFRAILARRSAGSVVHSHALSAVIAADLADSSGELTIQGFEMLKGIRGCSNRDAHRVPVVENTPEEPELAAGVSRVLRSSRFEPAHCALVRDHGAYIWGKDPEEASRHAEVYHFLFDAVLARRRLREANR
jgi:methylthioribulose-1-phosphate dehydratase